MAPETFWDRALGSSTQPSVLRGVSPSLLSRTQSDSKGERSGSRSQRTSSDVGKAIDENGALASVDSVRLADLHRVHSEQVEPNGPKLEKSEDPPTTGEIYRSNTEKSRTSLDKYVQTARFSHPGEKEIANELTDPDQPTAPVHPKPFIQSLKIYNGVVRHESWIKAAVRPVILFSYPAVLWSTVVYSFSVGWLILLSETMAHIYQNHPYDFSRLATGLVYISPFIGGIIGTAVAGKVSDAIVRAMSRRNGGVYEPEFRLVMGIPVAIATAIGLMGYVRSSFGPRDY